MLKLCQLIQRSWLAGRVIGYNPERQPPKDHSIKVWSQLARQFQRKRFLNIFPIGSHVKTMSGDSVVLVGGWGRVIQSWKTTTQGQFHQSLSQLAKQFQRRRFLNIFPLGSYVKTMSADVVGVGWRTGSSDTILIEDHLRTFQKSLVPIGPAVSENIFNDLFCQNFLFLAMAAILVGGWGYRIQILKGTTQGPSLPRLVQIGPVVSVETIKNVKSLQWMDGWTMDTKC